MSNPLPLRRWRLVLGRFADQALGNPLSEQDARMDRALDHVYGHAYLQRGYRISGGEGPGTLQSSQLSLPEFAGGLRRLFPQSVCETIEADALQRFGMTGFLSDPQVLESLTPSVELLQALLAFKGRASPELLQVIRGIARRVADEVMKQLRTTLSRALSGVRQRSRSSQTRVLRDLDWRGTIRANFKSWDRGNKRLLAQHLVFRARARRQLPWHIILCLDQSGSMLSSVIYTAVMAAILAALPSVSLKLVVFDTAVADLTGKAGDPVEVLMSVQLGGGTDIGQALEYCESLVTQPARTLLVLVSDLCEGGARGRMLRAVQRLAGARVTLLGLPGLHERCKAPVDQSIAQQLACAGMRIVTLTPDRFAQVLAGIIR